MVVSWNGGTPIAGWLGRIRLKWMRTGGSPISGNHHIYNYKLSTTFFGPSTVIHCPKSISSYLCPYKDYKHTINTTYITFTSGQPDVNNDP